MAPAAAQPTVALEQLEERVRKLEAQRNTDRNWAEQRFGRLDKRVAAMDDRIIAITVKIKTLYQHLGIKGRRPRTKRENSDAGRSQTDTHGERAPEDASVLASEIDEIKAVLAELRGEVKRAATAATTRAAVVPIAAAPSKPPLSDEPELRKQIRVLIDQRAAGVADDLRSRVGADLQALRNVVAQLRQEVAALKGRKRGDADDFDLDSWLREENDEA